MPNKYIMKQTFDFIDKYSRGVYDLNFLSSKINVNELSMNIDEIITYLVKEKTRLNKDYKKFLDRKVSLINSSTVNLQKKHLNDYNLQEKLQTQVNDSNLQKKLQIKALNEPDIIKCVYLIKKNLKICTLCQGNLEKKCCKLAVYSLSNKKEIEKTIQADLLYCRKCYKYYVNSLILGAIPSEISPKQIKTIPQNPPYISAQPLQAKAVELNNIQNKTPIIPNPNKCTLCDDIVYLGNLCRFHYQEIKYTSK